jgi:hypothetical protein
LGVKLIFIYKKTVAIGKFKEGASSCGNTTLGLGQPDGFLVKNALKF